MYKIHFTRAFNNSINAFPSSRNDASGLARHVLRGGADQQPQAVAAVQAPGEELASLMAYCNQCGAYTQGCHARSRLDGTCAKTARGLETLRLIHQGRHPRWKEAKLTALEPIRWGQAGDGEAG